MKISIKLTAAVLPFTILLGGCNKQNELIQPTLMHEVNVPDVLMENGMLHFVTQEQYRIYTDDLTDTKRLKHVSELRAIEGFTSAAESVASNERDQDAELAKEIESEYFRELLNDKLSIWIEDHIYRVNPVEEKVYVIEAVKYADKYDELVAQNTSDLDVKVYAAELNVLDIVRDGGEPQAIGCGQSAIGGREDGRFFTFQPPYDKYAYSKYQRYGIYFHLFTRIEGVQQNNPPPYRFNYTGSIWDGAPHIYYHPRCGGYTDYSTISTGTVTSGYQQFNSFQGSTALNEVYFYVHIEKNTSPYALCAEQFGFRVNI